MKNNFLAALFFLFFSGCCCAIAHPVVYPAEAYLNHNTVVGVHVAVMTHKVFVATTGTGVAASADDGLKWPVLYAHPSIASNVVSDVYTSPDAQDIYVATNRGLSVSVDAGKTWRTATKAAGQLASDAVLDVYASADGQQIYAATQAGLSVSTDAGVHWETYAAELNSPSVISVYAVGNGRTIYAATAAGLSVNIHAGQGAWTTYLSHEVVRKVVVSEDGQCIYAATDHGLQISLDGGAIWTAYNAATKGFGSDDVWGVAVNASENGPGIYAATSQGLSVSQDGGKTWRTVTGNTAGFGGSRVCAVSASLDGQTIFAATTSGLSISIDGGTTWKTTPVYGISSSIVYGYTDSEKERQVDTRSISDGRIVVTNTSDNVWEGFHIAMSGVTDGQLSVTGSTCDESLPPGQSCVYRLHYTASSVPVSTVLYPDAIFGQNATVTVTHDGDTARVYPIQLFHVNARHFLDVVHNNPNSHAIAGTALLALTMRGDKLYAGTAQGGLSVSADNGKTWTTYNSGNGLAGDEILSVYVGPKGQHIYVGTDMGRLSVSLDSGANWNSYDVAPGASAGDVNLLAANDSGDVIFAYTGQGLFVSQDGGEHWQPELSGETVDAMVVDRGRIYIGTDAHGLYVFDANNAKLVQHTLDNATVSAVCTSIDGQKIYVAGSLANEWTGVRVGELSGQGVTTWTNTYVLNSHFHSVTISPDEKTIYVGTCTEGTKVGTIISGNTVHWIGSSMDVSNAIVEAADGKTIFALAEQKLRKGLAKEDPAEWKVVNVGGDFLQNFIIPFFTSSDGETLYACTNYGLLISRDGGLSWRTYLPNKGINDVYVTDGGKHLYVAAGTYDEPDGVYIGTMTADGISWTHDGVAQGLGSGAVYTIYSNDQGKKIYAGTANGITMSDDYGSTWTNNIVVPPGKNPALGYVYASAEGKDVYAEATGGLEVNHNYGKGAWHIYYLGPGGTPAEPFGMAVLDGGQSIYLTLQYLSVPGGAFAVNLTGGEGDWHMTQSDQLGAGALDGMAIFDDAKTIYIAAEHGLLLSSDGGQTWARYHWGLANQKFLDVVVAREGSKVFVGNTDNFGAEREAFTVWD